MKQIFLITDYLNRFGTKYTAIPYRSGMDKELLREEFKSLGYEVVFIKASAVFERIKRPEGKLFIYTSSEDRGEHYKSFLEDVIIALEFMRGIVIPEFRFFRSHNNKVLVELLRKEWGPSVGDNLRSYSFGSYEEFKNSEVDIKFPVVVKRPEGFKSRGVYLADNMKELIGRVRRISRTPFLKGEMKDFIRGFIHKGFTKESGHRRKFILQEFIKGLENDFKVLIFGKRYYVLSRRTRKNDFRASGSGLLSYPVDLPVGLLDFCEKAYIHFDVPFVSLDIAFDNNSFYLMEAQFLYFGTYTIEHAEFYFTRMKDNWEMVTEKSVLEREYAQSIARYIENQVLKA